MTRFTEDHLLFRSSVRNFIDREIDPFVDDWENQGFFPARELYKKLGDEGYLGLTFPEEFGGLGLDFWYQVVWTEELGKISAGGIPMSFTVQTDISTPPIKNHGSPALKERFLRPAILGDAIGALAVTEPQAGSDVAAIKTFADDEGDDYVINGRKIYITNGSLADFVVVLCKTSKEESTRGMSLIVVPTDLPGFSAQKNYQKSKLGNWCCDHAELTFENVRVPKRYLIDTPGTGWDIQMEQFQHERLIEGILACSQAQMILDETKVYAKHRKLLDQRLIDLQHIAFRLVEMETEIALLRQMTYHAAELFIGHRECTREIAMVKFKGGKLLRWVADECLQLFGGSGYMENTLISRAFRDGRATSIAGGSTETMQHILAKFL